MKKLKKHKTTTKVAIFAGAAALMALTPQTRAQSTVDDLLNKLEQKGILTSDEAQQLKDEQKKETSQNFHKAFNSEIGMPDWVTGYKLYGDFRGRFDDESTDIGTFGGNDNNIRLRYRLRVGLTVNMKDNFQVGFRLGSSDSASSSNTTGGNPLSNNTTLQGNGSKKFIYVDAAYGKWTAINNGTWMVAGTIGKMDQPFQTSPMVFDPDYTPEGGALQAAYKINDYHSLRFNGAAFVLDQVNSRGPFLYGGQILWNARWAPPIESSLGIAGYNIANTANLKTTYDSNTGNTLTGGTYANDFNPIVASASVTYTLNSFPLYPGKFPIKVGGEYMENPAANGQNQGWWTGVSFGKAGKRGSWDVSYRYEWLEANAWWDQIVDDDNIAAFPTSATTGTAAGGTNIKGHLVKLNYMIFDSLTFSFTCYINDLISNPVPGASSSALHAMADLMWKF